MSEILYRVYLESGPVQVLKEISKTEPDLIIGDKDFTPDASAVFVHATLRDRGFIKVTFTEKIPGQQESFINETRVLKRVDDTVTYRHSRNNRLTARADLLYIREG